MLTEFEVWLLLISFDDFDGFSFRIFWNISKYIRYFKIYSEIYRLVLLMLSLFLNIVPAKMLYYCFYDDIDGCIFEIFQDSLLKKFWVVSMIRDKNTGKCQSNDWGEAISLKSAQEAWLVCAHLVCLKLNWLFEKSHVFYIYFCSFV